MLHVQDHQTDIGQIADLIARYFDALYQADSNKMSKIFHKDGRYVNAVEGDYMNHSLQDYLAILELRTPPAATGDARDDKILSIELGGNGMAFVKLSMVMMEREYLDFLSLIRVDGNWLIISKVFSYQHIHN